MVLRGRVGATWNYGKIVALTLFLYHLISSVFILLDSAPHLNLHLSLSLLVLFLWYLVDSKNWSVRIALTSAVILSVVSLFYFQFFWKEVTIRITYGGFGNVTDFIFGSFLLISILLILLFEHGIYLFLLVIVFLIYPFVARYVPGFLYYNNLDFLYSLSRYFLYFSDGIYSLLDISASYVFLFIVVGGMLEKSLGSKFFIYLGYRLSSLVGSGGVALVAVFSSALVGSTVGGGVSNVLITGRVTIPAMKRSGFLPEEAAAIEAVASNGSVIFPPVLGVLFFVLSGLSGIEYKDLCRMIFFPALFYYLSVGIYVVGISKKRRVKFTEEVTISTLEAVSGILWFFGIVSITFYLLIKGYSIVEVGFWLSVFSICMSIMERRNFRNLLDIIWKSVREAASICVLFSALGVIITVLLDTGLGLKISMIMKELSGSSLHLSLIMVFIICLLLGSVGLFVGAYLLMLIFAFPLLSYFSISFEVIHMFIAFCCIFALITPPVGIVTLVSSRLAGAEYFRAGLEVLKCASISLFLPFLVVYSPVLGRFGGVWDIIELLCVLLFVIGIGIFMSWPVVLVDKVLCLLMGVFSFIAVILDNYFVAVLAFVIFCVVLVRFLLYNISDEAKVKEK